MGTVCYNVKRSVNNRGDIELSNNRRQYYYDAYAETEREEQLRIERRRQKKAEIRRRRRRRVFINRCIFAACCLAIIIGAVFTIKNLFTKLLNFGGDKEMVAMEDDGIELDNTVGSNDYDLYNLSNDKGPIVGIEDNSEAETMPSKTYEAHTTDSTISPGDEIISERSIIIDLESGDILMQKGYKDRISPASMTKVLTVLVAAEHLTDSQLNDKFTITPEITYYAYKNDCSCVGFLDEESVTVRDMLFGTVLPSGADAAVGLATYIAGSHEAFVDMMNEKIDELGLSGSSHFTNCVGLYDDNHYSTVYDMAIIMEAAIDNDLAREALSAHKYTTSSTPEHPDGIEISNWFLRRIEDKDTGGEVICAKTGFVVQSKNCAVSFGKDSSGNEYVVCTQGSTSSWRCIYDHVAIYKQFAK